MTPDQFWSGVDAGLGLEHIQERELMWEAWHRREGMPWSTWNPIATCWLSADTPVDLSFRIPGLPPGNWNVLNPSRDPNYGVRVYASMEAGIAATVHTIQQGYYPVVRRVFAELTVYPGVEEEMLVDELATYVGSRAYGGALAQEWEGILADPRVDDIIKMLEAAGITQWAANGNEPIIKTVGDLQAGVATLVAALPGLQAGSAQAYALNAVLLSWQVQLAAQGINVVSSP